MAPGSETDAPQATDRMQITGVDYGFEGVPETVAIGTELAFTNASDTEFTLALGDEAMASMTFTGVAVAAPGEDGMVVDGDLTLTEAGRYVATCFIPVGADPDLVGQAMEGAEGEQPDLGDGPPHAMEGMVAEFVVE